MSSTGVHCLFIDYAKRNLLDLPLSDDIVILKHNALKENPKGVGLSSLKVWRCKEDQVPIKTSKRLAQGEQWQIYNPCSKRSSSERFSSNPTATDLPKKMQA